MMNIFQLLKLDAKKWSLMPVKLSTDLQSCHIGTMLADALQRTRSLLLGNNNNNESGSVVFLGMDAPELPLEEIITALAHPTVALLCPASDGGYGLLSIPPHAPCSQIFQNISWSKSLTAVSQLKALTDCNVNVRLGRLMHDVDEAEDVLKLAQRLCQIRNFENDGEALEKNNNNVLWRSSNLSRHFASSSTTNGPCEHTWNVLVSIGLIERRNDVGGLTRYSLRGDTCTHR